MRSQYEAYIYALNAPGSNKAPSYLRALDLLALILQRPNPTYPAGTDFWRLRAPAEIAALYELALREQKAEGSIFLAEDLPRSYGANGYYSAALKSYGEFLSTRGYIQRLDERWTQVQSMAGSAVSAELASVPFDEDEFSAELARLQARAAEDIRREVRARVHQDVFRRMLLANYDGRCALTGLAVTPVLRASHISPWSDDTQNRLNPSNGILLAATYDAAFDQHLMSFDEDGRMVLSPALKEHHGNEAFNETFLKLEGRVLAKPTRHAPSAELMARHREGLVGRLGMTAKPQINLG